MKAAKQHGIKSRLIKYYLICIITIILISDALIGFFLVRQTIKDSKDIYNELCYQISQRLESKLESINDMAVGIMFNSTIRNLLLNPGSLSSYPEQNLIHSVLFDFRTFLNVGNVVIFSLDGKVLTASEGYDTTVMAQDFEWYEKVKASQGQSRWEVTHIDSDDYKHTSQYVITLAKKIRRLDLINNSQNGEDLGYIMVNISESDINEVLSKTKWGRNGIFYIADSNGYIISHEWKDYIGEKGISTNEIGEKRQYMDWGDKQLVVIRSLNISDWYLVGTVGWNELFRDVKAILSIMLAVSVIASVIFIYFANVLSNRISKPLQELNNNMSDINDVESMSIQEFSASNIKEIDSLVDGYKSLIQRINLLIKEVYEAQIQQKDLEVSIKQEELKALQYQINPHFLYNTLDSINWMASLEGNSEVVDMVTSLGDFLRFSCKKEQFVTIREEVENVLNYIHIQSVRFGSEYSVDREIDEALMEYKTIKLILQPLVENAILHGFRENSSRGIITISIQEKEESLILQVKDNGSGIAPEKLNRLQTNLKENANIGLNNVRERLRLNYPNASDFRIESIPNAGTVITMEIPKQR